MESSEDDWSDIDKEMEEIKKDLMEQKSKIEKMKNDLIEVKKDVVDNLGKIKNPLYIPPIDLMRNKKK